MTELENKLIQFAHDPENPETNFELALVYDSMGQVASATSHYLRCAERTENLLLQYECLLKAGIATKKQGFRPHTEKSFFQNAISVLPNRPEAYSFLSDTFLKLNQHHNALLMACIGENCFYVYQDLLPLRTEIPYYGAFQTKFEKLVYSKKCGITNFQKDLQFLNNFTNWDFK